MEYGAVGMSEEAAVAKFGRAGVKVFASRFGVLEGASVYKEIIPKPRSSLFIGQNLWARNFALANNQPFDGQTMTHTSSDAASINGASGQPRMPLQPPQPPAMDALGRGGDPLHSVAVWARRHAQDSLRGRLPLTFGDSQRWTTGWRFEMRLDSQSSCFVFV